MSPNRVIKKFVELGLEDRIREFEEGTATVIAAAEALGCEPKRIAKSLSYIVGEEAVIVVAAGDARVDNRKYKDFFGAKAKMVNADELVELIGHPLGGVCPFELVEGVKVYLDRSLKRFETVFPACGADNNTVELTLDELEEYSDAVEWVDLCKDWEF